MERKDLFFWAFVVFLIYMILTGCHPTYDDVCLPATFYSPWRGSVFTKERDISKGTIFFANGHLYTARHVVEGCLPQYQGKDFNEMKFFGEDGIKTPCPICPRGVRELRIGEQPEIGDHLTAIGYGIDGETRRRIEVKGICAADRVATGQIRQGMSGGPVLNEYGEVVGVIYRFLPELGVYEFTPIRRE